MRKKSHISLAGYLVRELRLQELVKYKKAFYLGSILPDLNPKMVKEPHEIETSFEKFKDSICRLIQDAKSGTCNGRVFWRKLGMVIHYLADYFTFPHNTAYDGNLKDHCVYEGDMKYQMREYVRTPEAKRIFLDQREQAFRISSEEALFAYIKGAHECYLAGRYCVVEDCRWILEMSAVVLVAMLRMINEEYVHSLNGLCYAAA